MSSEFEEWKNMIRSTTDTDWVSYSRKQKNGKTYFRCNRSGNYEIITDKRDREFKGTFSTKTNTECASHLVLTERNGRCYVKFCLTHTSHSIEPEFLRTPNATKLDLEKKLKDGISVKTILATVRKEMDPSYEDANFISKKTLENLINKSGIGREYQLHTDDAMSVDEFVKADNGKSVILYKPVGKLDSKYPELQLKDFGLAIMNTQQKELLRKAMTSPPSVLCSDATHGTNQYDLKLITIMIVNEFGNGLPVAFFFSTKEDQDALSYLFLAIKSVVGNLTPMVSLIYLFYLHFKKFQNLS